MALYFEGNFGDKYLRLYVLVKLSIVKVKGTLMRWDKKDIERGLEWLDLKTRITIHGTSKELIIIVFPEYPNENKTIQLSLDISVLNNVKVTDLVGNGYGTKFQDKG